MTLDHRTRRAIALCFASTATVWTATARADDRDERGASGGEPAGKVYEVPVLGVSGPETLPYAGPDAIPPGYHEESSPRWGLVGTGIALGSALWIASMAAAVKLDAEKDRVIVDEQGGTRTDPEYSGRYAPMFIPVAGPFLAIATSDATGTGAAILTLDGVLQVGALAMTVAGFAAPKRQLVRDREVTITPLASSGFTGLAVRGSL